MTVKVKRFWGDYPSDVQYDVDTWKRSLGDAITITKVDDNFNRWGFNDYGYACARVTYVVNETYTRGYNQGYNRGYQNGYNQGYRKAIMDDYDYFGSYY